MNAIIVRRKFLMSYTLKDYLNVLKRFRDSFTFRPSDLITTMTYALMENFTVSFILN